MPDVTSRCGVSRLAWGLVALQLLERTVARSYMAKALLRLTIDLLDGASQFISLDQPSFQDIGVTHLHFQPTCMYTEDSTSQGFCVAHQGLAAARVAGCGANVMHHATVSR